MLKIESGTRLLNDGSYVYSYWKDGEYYVVTFTAAPNDIPEIGDFIEGGVLIKRDGIQVSNDGERKWPGSVYEPNGWQEQSYAHNGWKKGDCNA